VAVVILHAYKIWNWLLYEIGYQLPKEDCKTFVLSNVMYSPNHSHVGAPTINIQSTLHTAPDLCKHVSLQYMGQQKFRVRRKSFRVPFGGRVPYVRQPWPSHWTNCAISANTLSKHTFSQMSVAAQSVRRPLCGLPTVCSLVLFPTKGTIVCCVQCPDWLRYQPHLLYRYSNSFSWR